MRSPFFRKLVVFLMATAACSAVTAVVLSAKPHERVAATDVDTRPTRMPVTVRRIDPQSHAATITAMGEVAPLWQTTIRARVDGPISHLSPCLKVGHAVRQGDLLVRILPNSYRMQVAEARSRLAGAAVALMREEREAREAHANWQRSGLTGDPASPLVLREPQLAAARAEVDAAQAALVQAETMLQDTDMRAPFDAIIGAASVNPGETLFAGDPVATLFDMTRAEIGVHLDAARWDLLPASLSEIQATLVDPRGHGKWRARAVRHSRHLDPESRLRILYVQVDQPLNQHPPLLPGSFVRVEMTGRTIPDLIRIPASSFTDQGIAWFVDADHRLRSWATTPVFYGHGEVYLRRPDALEGPVHIALSPHDGYTAGLTVQPLNENKEG